MREILLPRIDPEMKSGTILNWIKMEGDQIQKGEPIVEIEGEKVIFNIESPEKGILAKILVKAGNLVPIGTPIAVLANNKEEIAKTIKLYSKDITKQEIRLKASPLARRIAKEHSLNLTKIEGTGPKGRISKKDVIRVIEKMKEKVKPVQKLETFKEIPLVGIQKTIADRMTFSRQMIPQAAITMEVDVSNFLQLQQIMKKIMQSKIPFTAFLTKIVANSLRKYPILNSSLEENKIKIFKNINIGIAIAIENGLVVPVVHDSDKKSFKEIVSLIKKLVEKARERKLSIDELNNGTFTITNLGGFGVDVFIPIINPPQSAILGIGKITKKSIVIDNEIKIHPMMTLTIVFDHRIINGEKAAQFLKEIKNVIEDPYEVFIDPI
ncbi:MAG: dihydrolipoamide acetyltransferase family protein [Candidatus Hodarchaeales archaeon]|jgi:pyruvate dehydrogenase E2 component (dihydrolipoamide acetyltransferase)